ncbi:hypothetical protein D3C76_1527680 [compost metagenome]
MQHGDSIAVKRIAGCVSMSQKLAEDVLQVQVDFQRDNSISESVHTMDSELGRKSELSLSRFKR